MLVHVSVVESEFVQISMDSVGFSFDSSEGLDADCRA